MIAIDWGSSNFRAFRLDDAGTIMDRRTFASGILRVAEGRFAETLQAHVGDWIGQGEHRILLSGMVGSRQGWTEVPYLACPVTTSDLARHVTHVAFDEAEVLLIPGVKGTDADGIPEVMRGEETEAMGIVEACEGAALVCLPGTHSKWVKLQDRAIISFNTCMTGDVFSALQKETILAHTISADAPHSEAAFDQGVQRSRGRGGLLHHLFSVRTLMLTGALQQDASGSYLSGLLIGHEVRQMNPHNEHVHLVGAVSLCLLYAQAIDACGGSVTLEDEDAAARGLAAISRSLPWS